LDYETQHALGQFQQRRIRRKDKNSTEKGVDANKMKIQFFFISFFFQFRLCPKGHLVIFIIRRGKETLLQLVV